MAQITVCDVCGCVEGVRDVFFATGTSPDGAGQMSDDGERYDLCVSCELEARRVGARALLLAERWNLNRWAIEHLRVAQTRKG